ncbi:MAG: hypothetical protein AAB776_01365 [Patescibacteria group bacterium]
MTLLRRCRKFLIAQLLDAKCVINMSNIDFVYSDDPRTNPEAKAIQGV